MNYTFTSSKNEKAVEESSKILNIADGYSGEEETKIQGQLLTLFGEPIYTSPNLEDAYLYAIIATDDAGVQTALRVYEGPSGSAIGGDQTIKGIENIANELKQYIKQAEPKDFEYEGYYSDGGTKIKRSIKNGIVHYSET